MRQLHIPYMCSTCMHMYMQLLQYIIPISIIGEETTKTRCIMLFVLSQFHETSVEECTIIHKCVAIRLYVL